MEKSEGTKYTRISLTIPGGFIIVTILVVGLAIAAWFCFDYFRQQNESQLQNYGTKIQSLIDKYDSLRSLDMAVIAKLSEKKPVVFIPKPSKTSPLTREQVQQRADVAYYHWINGDDGRKWHQVAGDILFIVSEEYWNKGYREGFKDGYNKGRRTSNDNY